MKQKRRQKCWVTHTRYKKVSNFRQIDLPVFAIWNKKKEKKCYHYRTESNNEEKLEGDYFFANHCHVFTYVWKNERDEIFFFLKVQFAESSFSIISRLNNLFIVWPFSTFIPFEGFQKADFHCNIITHRLSTFCHVICWQLGCSFVLTFNRFLRILGWNVVIHIHNVLNWRLSEVFSGKIIQFLKETFIFEEVMDVMVWNCLIFNFCHFLKHTRT